MISHLECYFIITDLVVKYLKLDSLKKGFKKIFTRCLKQYLSVSSLHFKSNILSSLFLMHL